MTRDLKLECPIGKHIQREGIQSEEDLRKSIPARDMQVHGPQGSRELGVEDFKRRPGWPEWRVMGREAPGEIGKMDRDKSCRALCAIRRL